MTAGSPQATFDDIIHAKLLADLLCVYGLAPVGKCGAAGDDKEFRSPRQIRGQIVGDGISEITLLRSIGEVGERQDHYRKAGRDGPGAGRRLQGAALDAGYRRHKSIATRGDGLN